MAALKISRKSYPAQLLLQWKAGDYDWLTTSKASESIRKVLRSKAKTRREGRIREGKSPDRRFFGEAYAAICQTHENGWYSSFKWLMASRYVSDRDLPTAQHGFRAELKESFDDQLRNLQVKASILWSTHRRMLDGKKPVPPDLWLVTRRGRHRFVEVKLPGDTIKPHQLAGLALIATSLRDSKGRPVSVEIVKLFCRPVAAKSVRREKEASARETEQFHAFCRAIRESR